MDKRDDRATWYKLTGGVMTTPKTANKKSINDIPTQASNPIEIKLRDRVEIHNRMVERKNEILDELNKLEAEINKNLGQIEAYSELVKTATNENGKALETTEK